jgi:hypothetical protein
MLEPLFAFALLAPRIAEAAILIVAASVSIWSRRAARRAEGRRLVRLLRRGDSGSS